MAFHEPVEVSGEVAFDAAADLAWVFAVGAAAFGVGPGRGVAPSSGHGDGVQRRVEPAVAGSVEPAALDPCRFRAVGRGHGGRDVGLTGPTDGAGWIDASEVGLGLLRPTPVGGHVELGAAVVGFLSDSHRVHQGRFARAPTRWSRQPSVLMPTRAIGCGRLTPTALRCMGGSIVHHPWGPAGQRIEDYPVWHMRQKRVVALFVVDVDAPDGGWARGAVGSGRADPRFPTMWVVVLVVRVRCPQGNDGELRAAPPGRGTCVGPDRRRREPHPPRCQG